MKVGAAVVVLLAGLAQVGAAGAQINPNPTPAPEGTVYAKATRMSASAWRARQDTYLAAATSGGLNTAKPESLIAFAERGRRDPRFDGDISAATAATFDDILGDGFNDDFTISTLLTLWIQDHHLLEPSLAAAIKAKILSFKYWWTEPPITETPGSNYYWTENHQIIFAADEYLAGQAFPDDVFGRGMTGRQHMAHALPNIARWIELRGKYGFSEFLSNPYTAMTFEGVLSLADLAKDPEVAEMTSRVLDMLLVEVASHLQDGYLASAKGRTYTGHLLNLQGGGTTPALISLIFGSGTPPTGSGPATAMAVSHRYRPPEVAIRIAASKAVAVVRQHQSMPLDPTAPVVNPPIDPDGLPFTGDDGLLVWWGLGAQLAWQVTPLSVRTINTYNLWDTPNFQVAGADVLKNIVAGKTELEVQVLAQSLAKWLNPGLLSAVNTYTWRSPDAMLSTAQDWRTGQRTESALVSQATLNGAASVFTSLPKGAAPGQSGSGGGYWSGDGAAPRAAQVDDTVISIYAPQYDSAGVNGPIGYQTYTHAFFPQDRFDQVVQRDGWTFGRQGDGYVALWSWRPTRWVPFNAAVEHPDGVTSPWELIADGGSDNVWITQVGRAADQGGAADPFAAFQAAVTAHRPEVRPMAAGTPCAVSTPATLGSCSHGRSDGFLVSYASGTRPALGFGWSPKAAVAKPSLTKGGTPVVLDDPAHRWASPWASSGTDGRYRVRIDGAALDLDLRCAPVAPSAGVRPNRLCAVRR